MKIVITGANRGIGLEFVRQYLARGDAVIATARASKDAGELQKLRGNSSGALTLFDLDVSSNDSVASLGRKISEPVDILVNNAGVSGEKSGLDTFDPDGAIQTFSTNAVGPLRVSRALLPQLRKGKAKKIFHISSKMGSIEDNTSGGSYAYRMSKAALNMGSRSLSHDLRSEGILSVAIHPGWVKTDMGGRGAPVEPPESVDGMIKLFDSLTLEQSGRFYDFRGAPLPW